MNQTVIRGLVTNIIQ